MSFESRDFLRHILVEADYLIARSAGLSEAAGVGCVQPGQHVLRVDFSERPRATNE